MSKPETVKSTVVTDETPVEEPKKKLNFTKKQIITTTAAVVGTAAVVVLAIKAKNGAFEDLSVGDLVVTEITDAVKA